jgi:hypothetical protein
MKKIILLITILGVTLGLKAQNPTSYTAEKTDNGSAFLNLKNTVGFWHLSGPRSYEPNNPFSIYWNDGSYHRYFSILDNGNIGIGTTTPNQRLSIQGDNTSVSVSQGTYNYSTNIPIGAQLGVWDGSYTNAAGIKFHRWRGATNAFANAYIGQANFSGEWGLDFRVENQTSASNPTKSRMYIKPNGNVGIGTTNPQQKLQIGNNGFTFHDGGHKVLTFNPNTTNSGSIRYDLQNKRFTIETVIDGNYRPHMIIASNGNTAIYGKLEAKEVKVTLTPTADFVFEENYNLPTLDFIEKHIKERKHLPEIASAKEMKEKGVNIGDFQIQLLQKIEELTLYTIEQEKRLNSIESKNKILEKENEVLKSLTKRLTKIEEQLKKKK